MEIWWLKAQLVIKKKQQQQTQNQGIFFFFLLLLLLLVSGSLDWNYALNIKSCNGENSVN